jgi:integrase
MAICNTVPGAEAVATDCATWPEACRRRWIEAFEPDLGTHDWSRASQYTYGRVFTRYLNVLRRYGMLDVGCALTPAGLRTFVREAEATASARTVAGYVHQLLEVATVVYPDEVRAGSLDWLWRTRDRMAEAAGRTPKRRRRQVVGAGDLLRVARHAIAHGKATDNFVLLRTGVFILLGVHVPERRRALAGLDISMIDLETGTVRLPAHLQKTAEAVVREIPPRVRTVLQDFIEHWRARYTDDREGALFITTTGRRVGGEALRAAMVTLTERELGIKVPPHLMRNAVATTVIEAGPGNAPLATAALLHRNAATTNEYTGMARDNEASRLAAGLLGEAQDAAGRAVRTTTRSRMAGLRRRR